MPKLKNGAAVVAMLLLVGSACADPGAAGAPAAGIYAGSTTTYRYPGPIVSTPRRLFGAVAKDSTGYFISVPAASSDVYVFRNLHGIGKFTSAEYEVPTEGRAVSRGPRNWKIEIRPAGASLYALHGKFNNISGYVALDLQMLSLTSSHVSLSVEAATYRGFDVNRDTRVEMTLDAQGRLSGTDTAGCRISGTLTRIENLDLFDAGVTFAGAPACHGTLAGVAFFATRDRTGRFSGAKGHYLYLIGANRNFRHGFAIALSRQGK